MQKYSKYLWPAALFAVFALAILLYLPSIMGGAVWDDDRLLTGDGFGGNNFHSALVTPFLYHYFRPLTSLSLVLDATYAKQTPFFYHQTNMLLHALTAVLVAYLALLLTKSRLAGFLAGLFFTTQTLQVGATAWIGGRTDVLSAFCLVLFLVSLVSYHQKPSRWWLAASVITFFLAAIAKEQAIAILPAVPMSVFVFGSRKWKDAWRLTAWFGIAIVGFVVFWIINAPAPHGAKAGVIYTVVLALRTAAHYGLELLVPTGRSMMTFTLENYHGPAWTFLGLGLVLLFALFVKLAWKSHREWAWLAICGLLVYMPISNFPPVPTFSIAPYRCAESGVAAACLMGILGAWAAREKRFVVAGLLGANFIAAPIASRWGIRHWSTPLTFFETAARTDYHFMIGVANYSRTLTLNGRSQEGLAWTDRTLTWVFGTPNWIQWVQDHKGHEYPPDIDRRLKSNSGLLDRRGLGWAMNVDAMCLSDLRRPSEAIVVEREALNIAPDDPRLNLAYGQMILSTDHPLAMKYLEYALKLAPNFDACVSVLGHEYVKEHRYADAIRIMQPVAKRIAWTSDTWLDLANCHIALHQYAAAEADLKEGEKALFVKKWTIADARKKLAALKAGAAK